MGAKCGLVVLPTSIDVNRENSKVIDYKKTKTKTKGFNSLQDSLAQMGKIYIEVITMVHLWMYLKRVECMKTKCWTHIIFKDVLGERKKTCMKLIK